MASLVSFKDNPQGNIWPNCNTEKIHKLIEKAKTLIYKCAIEIFDTASSQEKPQWHIKFMCAEGYDFDEKEKYCCRIWGDKQWRIV